MHNKIRLGRIAGLPVAAHWSVAVILLLFTWSLAEVSLPAAAPGYGATAYWLVGLVTTVLLLASLTAHELAHAIVARRSGVEVDDLTLWLFGGVTTLRGEAPSPGADFRIAAAGPATSIGLGVGFGVLALGLTLVGGSDLSVSATWWLAATNMLLAAFNLIPGAPLDGGRILRSALWHRRGDRAAATISAARSGQVVGYGLIALGLLAFVAGGGIGGIWLVFIGWFLLSAAEVEQRQVVARELLADVRVADVMTPAPVTAPGWLTIDAFVEQHVLGQRHSAYPVVDVSGAVEGLVTLTQLRTVPPTGRSTVRLDAVALPLDRVPTAGPDDPLAELVERSSRETGGRALVLDGSHLVGIVTPADVTRLIEMRALGGVGTRRHPHPAP